MSGFGFNPFGNLGGSGDDPDDLAGKIPLFAELQKLLSGAGGPVNWDLARQLAISNLAAGHRDVSGADTAAAAEVLRLADLWLDEVTDMPSGVTKAEAWSQVDWVEKTIGTWATLCDPVASRVVTAMSGSMPSEVSEQVGALMPMMSQLSGLFFGAQLGQGLAVLAGDVVSSSDVGLPLGPSGTAALLLKNVDTFAEGLERPVNDVRLFLALREAAHQRLFGHVPWLRQQVVDAVDAYGRGIAIDPEAINNAMASIDPSNPESLQNALTSGLFEPQNTDAQNQALIRLETLLALIEGWVDSTVTQAVGDRMPSAAALSEAMRRRRATGGPAEETFATLVGLELRPRRLREASYLWDCMTERHGTTARDGLWSHPDLMPSASDLDDPNGFVDRFGGGFDSAAFEKALHETLNEISDQNSTSSESPGSGSRPDSNADSDSSSSDDSPDNSGN